MIIIPARLGSSRFENKVMVDILGLPMVIRTAKQVEKLDEVVIATDSQKIIDLASKYNIKAILTSNKHNSGTDRINETVNKLNLNENEIIINVQADEPFIEPEVIKSVIDKTKSAIKDNNNTLMVSCYKEVSKNIAEDPNLVKVVINNKNNALYFSRSVIPFYRENNNTQTYYGHLGIYGFTKKTLNTFCSLPNSKLENTEKLEQLRVLDNDYKIAMVKVKSNSFGIDTKEDLKNAINYFS